MSTSDSSTHCIEISNCDNVKYTVETNQSPQSNQIIHPKDKINQKSMSNNDHFLAEENQRKKVHFPEEIVTDFFESKNYWTEHRFCSSEELIEAYKRACDHANIKPIPILLEQLKGIDGRLCPERYDMLNMSNVKLDPRQIECMEEVFKRVQFKNLNFENANLDDESASSLFEIIEFYESCSRLNVSMNSRISSIGFNTCAKMLKKTSVLESIELRGIMFTDSTIPPLSRALRCGSPLKVLHLENSNICSKNLLILTSALKLNIHLKELHLSSNRMVPSDGIQLGSLLKVNRQLEMLDVRNNSLGDIGLGHICDGLSEQFSSPSNRGVDDNPGQGLLCLILWSNSITYNGMPALSDALKVNRSLQSLNLGNNPISSEGIHALREGLLVNRSLLRLSLPCCRISCEGGVAIAEYLADTKQLMRLDLRDNDIRTAGLMAISHSMKVNKSLIRLDIDQVSKRDPNVKGFIETQLESLKIIQERIQENKKAVTRNQDLELAHNLQSLSNNSENKVETSLDSVVFLPSLTPDETISESVTNNVLSSSETISENENHVDKNRDSSNTDLFLDKNNTAPPTKMSLCLSPDTETSFDSPSSLKNNFSNKILSPTDTILELAINPDFTLPNSSTEYLDTTSKTDECIVYNNISNTESEQMYDQINEPLTLVDHVDVQHSDVNINETLSSHFQKEMNILQEGNVSIE